MGFGELTGVLLEASLESVDRLGDVALGGDTTVIVLDLRDENEKLNKTNFGKNGRQLPLEMFAHLSHSTSLTLN